MEFGFTEDQFAFRDAVRDLLAKECPPAVVRAAWTNADGRSGGAWHALGAMGVLGALVPESAGGLGLTELDVSLHETALDLLGFEAELESAWMKGFEFALSGPIYAGTNEIQRNVIAERVLGLPRK